MMKLRGNFLCWLAVMAMFCVVSYGGCGGSSDSNFAGNSRDVTIQDNTTTPDNQPDTTDYTTTPDNHTDTITPEADSPDVQPSPEPAPSPEPNNNSNEEQTSWVNAVGTWRIDSATLDFLDGRIGTLTHPLAPTFEITYSAVTGIMNFGGEGVETVGELTAVKWYYLDPVTGSDNDVYVAFPTGPLDTKYFDYVGDNTYEAHTYKARDDNPSEYTISPPDSSTYTISFPDSSTMIFTLHEFYADGSRLGDEISVTLKRVN